MTQDLSFDYHLYNQSINNAAEITNQFLDEPSYISVFSPYGFELHDFPYPKWPTRHYPVLGYPVVFSRRRAGELGESFKDNLLSFLEKNNPVFYERLHYVEIHRGAYSLLKQLLSPNVNTLHIELFPLSPGESIIDHYAKYLICLFGAIFKNNPNLPEIREFYLSKTRRNRLFQEYVMCEAMISKLDKEFPNRSPHEECYFQEIFKQLRAQNVSEVIRGTPTKKMECTFLEEELCDQLIFERMEAMRKCLKNRSKDRGNELTVLRSPTYYDDGKHSIEVQIGKADLENLMFHIRKVYK